MQEVTTIFNDSILAAVLTTVTVGKSKLKKLSTFADQLQTR